MKPRNTVIALMAVLALAACVSCSRDTAASGEDAAARRLSALDAYATVTIPVVGE